MFEKYGFVYIWYDRKHKRYYIGSHWGTEDDGYICSSSWMNKSYKRRPNDFKRKILSIIRDRKILAQEELHWLSFIKQKELGKKYYNQRIWSKNYIGCLSDETKEKISKANKGKIISEETRKKISLAKKGKRMKQESIDKMAVTKRGKSNPRQSERLKGIKNPEHSKKMAGRKQLTAHIQKRADSNRKIYKFINPYGETIIVSNLKEFSKNEGLSYSKMCMLYRGTYCSETYRKWKAA